MSDLVSVSSEGGNTLDGFEAVAHLNDGFLGTGYTSSVEISFIAMALIFGYVAISTARYFLSGTDVAETLGELLGLRGN